MRTCPGDAGSGRIGGVLLTWGVGGLMHLSLWRQCMVFAGEGQHFLVAQRVCFVRGPKIDFPAPFGRFPGQISARGWAPVLPGRCQYCATTRMKTRLEPCCPRMGGSRFFRMPTVSTRP